jgi:ISXO2-like transposase domain
MTTDGHSAYKISGVPTRTRRSIMNTVEGHRSLLKRAIKGTHVQISSKHAWKYIAEFSYRRNMRHSHWAMFNLLVQAFSLPRLQES